MAKYTLKRVFYMLITLFIIASITFFLMKLLPGTPYRNQEKLSDEQIHIMNEKYGLNDPVPVQYFNYMTGLVKGDLGVSFQLDNRPVSEILGALIGPSVTLALEAMVFGLFFGIILGVIAAMYQNRWPDYTSTFIAILGKSIPSFVFATVLQYWIGAKLQWLPVAGWGTFADSILPAFALAMFPLATAARFMRTELIDVFASDYILLAKAKGNSRTEIAVKHAIRNALIPLITVIGPLSVSLMTGSLVIENIYGIPGIGSQFVSSIQTNDYPVIMGTTILFAVMLIFIILVVDILYGLIDPRIRVSGGKK
ncbi:oligopeptide ABC transporter permease [Listeria fleischmannii 1991]|jgi:oligopeptide transport system permease protein|uniref:Oligopeptide transport system permease protein oppB n=4 Tax=Listeria fleischmannii TaxID=1069827 RepID=A0A2X3GLW3_9LIST|nr:oligopeptide ABC transporter permease [Listeria fleischmannii]EIA20247.1 oligopeptide ABC transporter permease [Listeria fleischmannii subsp. coloradonensis]EMG28119.1 oligopeptide ABC transporter permease [Listeria fleischmannii subsp. fleischmannii LU2006-1]EUJ59480.1 oligopeptide ABC transporter permease [Listeria fleischmannii FSL S10-1203]KMT58422.1 oligopeptide ABC transporter permease [Listeria fleischmannii 1991]MBC1397754.1 ABC transporter permease [Listeria fleischmannii]